MEQGPTDLSTQAKDLSSSKARDHIANLIKAAFNLVPVFGGPISSLIDDYIPETRQKRIEEFSVALAEEMERLSHRIDESRINTEEFTFLFVRVYENVSKQYQTEKLIAYRNILVNSLIVDIDASIQERYLHLVEQLTPLHLRVLSVFISDEANRQKLPPNFSSGSLIQTISKLLGLTGTHIRSCVFDMDQMGITNNVSGSLGAMMTPAGAMNLEGRLSDFGNGFVRFISQQ